MTSNYKDDPAAGRNAERRKRAVDALEQQVNVLIKARFLLPSLSKTERKAAERLLADPKGVANMTLTEFAEDSQTSQASIIRFCRRLGLDGYPDLKMHTMLSLRQQEENPSYRAEVNAEDSIRTILEKVFSYHIQTLKDTLALVSEDYDKALQALVAARAVHFFGLGDAVLSAMQTTIKLRRVGIHCTASADVDMQLITAATMRPGDVAIAISHTGRTRSTIEAMRIAKESGATTICITATEKSPLTRHCDYKLFTATIDVTAGRELVGQRVAEQGILEALYLGVITKGQQQDYEDRLQRIDEIVEFNKV